MTDTVESICRITFVTVFFHSSIIDCLDLISEYGPPFEDIVSPNPSIEEMKNIVADQQKRPEIPRGFIINSVH